MEPAFLSDVVNHDVTDRSGASMRLSQIVRTGFLLPNFAENLDNLKSFPELQMFSDDVIVCGYPKCGTHWIWEIVGMLLSSSADYIHNIKENTMLEAMSLDDLPSMSRPRTLNSHLPLRLLPPSVVSSNPRIVLLLRHPKDIVVSLYNHVINGEPMYHYSGTWSDFLHLFYQGKVEYGNYWTYIKEWERDMRSRPDLPIHIIHYENMKQQPEKEIERLAEFLGVEASTQLVSDIAHNTSFSRMKAAKSALDDDEERSFWKDGRPMMYRKGEMNDWRNWFTVAQSDEFDAIFAAESSSSDIVCPTYAPPE